MDNQKSESRVLKVCLFAFSVNLLLFFVKLYIGLSSNSISIFSDAVNNLFDSLSGLLTLVCLWFVIKANDSSTHTVVRKSEQLFSFLMAVIVSAAGFMFAYSALERLMYPTPVWYMTKYMAVLLGTMAVKLLMFVFYKNEGKKSSSPIIKVMAYDCILDFFITAFTVLTLVLSKSGSYAFDAVFGLVISVIIIASAIKMIISSAASLINHVSADRRERTENILEENGISFSGISYHTDGESTEAYIALKSLPKEETMLKVKKQCLESEDMIAVFAIK